MKVEPFKMQQFRNVKSRVKQEMEWGAKENNSMQQQRHRDGVERDDAGRGYEEEEDGKLRAHQQQKHQQKQYQGGQQSDGQAKAQHGSPPKPFLKRGTLDIRKAQV